TSAPLPFTVTSSIANGQQLSGRITWSATVSSTKPVAGVGFVVDDRVIAIDTSAPYAITLDTTTISNGSHAFAVIAGATDGTKAMTSATAQVANLAPPKNVTLPTIGGSTRLFGTLSAATGSWANSPTSYSYQWLRCDRFGNSCGAIGGATSSSYRSTVADYGRRLRVVVTARNAAGS